MIFLITSGGTQVDIDDMRVITNHSKGTFGNHLARVAIERNHIVTFLCADNSKCPHEERVRLDVDDEEFEEQMKQLRLWRIKLRKMHTSGAYSYYYYRTLEEYGYLLERFVKAHKPNVVLLAAAVSDYVVKNKAAGKISSDEPELTITLEQAVKFIRLVKEWNPHTLLVGFKLLIGASDEQLVAAMKKQVASAHSDLVVGNDWNDVKMGKHRLILYSKGEIAMPYEASSGRDMAKALIQRIEEER